MNTFQTRRRLLQSTLALSAGAAGLVHAPSLFAQAKYPSRPVEFIVPWGAGGGADQLARKVGKILEADLKASFPIVNVAGATGNTGMTKMLTAAADGYSIGILIGDTLATLAGGGARWKLNEIVPLGIMIRQPTGIFVKADSKYKTFQDLLNDTKSNEVKVAILGFGSADEIMVKQMVAKGHKMRMVPFAKPGERYSSILGGHADVLLEQAGDVGSFLSSKQMRPLAFFADAPAPGFPNVPLVKDSGFPISISQFRAIVMRAGTDAGQVSALAAAIERAAKSAEFKQYLSDEQAYADSFIAQKDSMAFLQRELKAIESNKS
ncbi:tripartite tricarboxylate transporter substrate binding protein [beta proteobacterium MWH-UniP1]